MMMWIPGIILGIAIEIGLYVWLPGLNEFGWHVCVGTMVILAILLVVHMGIQM